MVWRSRMISLRLQDIVDEEEGRIPERWLKEIEREKEIVRLLAQASFLVAEAISKREAFWGEGHPFGNEE